jgi:hypothetical protein
MADDASKLEDELPATDLLFDLEEGDHVWAAGLLPEVQYVQATSTISQRLAESFSKHTESKPTLPTGGMGSSSLISDYVKMFGQVFSEEGFCKGTLLAHLPTLLTLRPEPSTLFRGPLD